jgi:hypothetical protein
MGRHKTGRSEMKIKRNSAGGKQDFSQLDKQELLILVMNAQEELRQKKLLLREARSRLVYMRKKIRSLKESVDYQRKRIVDLYKNQNKIEV